MRSFVIAALALAATTFAASEQPKLDGRVDAVSQSDVHAITAAARQWLHHTPDFVRRFGQQVSLIHIVSHNKAEVHIGRADIPRSGYFIGSFITVERTRGGWRAGDATVVGADTLR